MTGERWRRVPAVLVALATPGDLLVALAASVHALYYVALFLFVPLAVVRAALLVGAVRSALRPERRARWVWAGTLAHAVVAAVLLREPTAEMLRGTGPAIGPDGWMAAALFAWPYPVALLAGAALVREMRSGRATAGVRPG